MDWDSVEIVNADCMSVFPTMADNSVDFTLTDIPYDEVHQTSNGLRELDKNDADTLTFPLNDFLEQVYRVTANSCCIFCGWEQFSTICSFFRDKKGTFRPLVWRKTNPSPMNGQHTYLSGLELAVWFKKRGAKTFNAFCKTALFQYPNGKSKVHPTEKNLDLFVELVADNTDPGQTVFDPCMGSGTSGVAAVIQGRRFKGVELNPKFFEIADDRIMTTPHL